MSQMICQHSSCISIKDTDLWPSGPEGLPPLFQYFLLPSLRPLPALLPHDRHSLLLFLPVRYPPCVDPTKKPNGEMVEGEPVPEEHAEGTRPEEPVVPECPPQAGLGQDHIPRPRLLPEPAPNRHRQCDADDGTSCDQHPFFRMPWSRWRCRCGLPGRCFRLFGCV